MAQGRKKVIDEDKRKIFKPVTLDRGITASTNREMLNIWLSNPETRILSNEELAELVGMKPATFYRTLKKDLSDPISEFTLKTAEKILVVYNSDIDQPIPDNVLIKQKDTKVNLTPAEAKRLAQIANSGDLAETDKKTLERITKKITGETPRQTVEKMNRKPLDDKKDN